MTGVLDNIQLLGRITGRENQAEAIVNGMEARIEAVMNGLRDVEHGPRLFYELDPALYTVGPSSFIGNILGMLKIRNVAEGAIGPYPQITTEVIVEKDPEVIILGDSSQYLRTGITLDSVVNRPGWGSITAVMTGHVYAFDDSLLSRPGPRIVEGIEGLAEILYPELFP
jgi:iron complex transport system substrate-binding protein